MDFRFFFDPGYLGRPLWPADSSGPVGHLPCLPRSRRFIGGPLALLVEISVSLQSWQAIGFVFPASLCLLGRPGPVSCSPHNTSPCRIVFDTLFHLQHSRGRSRPLIFLFFYVYVIFRMLRCCLIWNPITVSV